MTSHSPAESAPFEEESRAPGGGALRADAARNRERILVAARQVFAEQGIDASTNEVARQAGVGIATLFRRFPSREELLQAVFAEKMTDYRAATEGGLTHSDPWVGFCETLERICEMQAEDRGFSELLTLTFPMAKALETERDLAARALTELIRRAQEAGQLRADFAHQDVALMLMSNAGVIAATREAAPEAWRRMLGYFLQGASAQAAAITAPQLPPAPAPATVYRALLRLSRPNRT